MVTEFQKAVYELCSRIPRGKVTTYKEIAHALNSRAYRAVGQALRANPYAPQVPCHRVVASDGSIGGFGGEISGKNIAKKIKLLQREGVKIRDNRIVNFDSSFFKLTKER